MIKVLAYIGIWFAGIMQITSLVIELINESDIPVFYNITMMILNILQACYGIDKKDPTYTGMCVIVFILYLIHLIL